MMFEKGNYVVHNGHGVCKICEIVNNCYKLETIHNGMSILMPCEKAVIFLRPLLSMNDIKKAISEVLTTAEPYIKDNKERRIQFQTMVTSNDIHDTLLLLFQIYQISEDKKKEKKNLGSFDSQFLQVAERKVLYEISIAANITKEESLKYIYANLKPQLVL